MIKEVKDLGKCIITKVFGEKWKGSKDYWNTRYKRGGTSGAGSYNRLAEFKADIINGFVKDNNIKTVLEWGCGDGNQLKYANYPQYIGLDISEKAIDICKELYKNDTSKEFFYIGDDSFKGFKAELVLSLDVIYHLVEDDVYEQYMNNLISSSSRYIIIYSCNEDEIQQKLKHIRKRKFSTWMDENAAAWKLQTVIPNKYKYDPNDKNDTSWSDFYIYMLQDGES